MYQRTIPVAASSFSGRNDFISKTYFHVFFAIVLFIGLEFIFFNNGVALVVTTIAASTNWMVIVGSVILLSTIATLFAHNSSSKTAQYLALTIYVFMKSLIFVPILYYAEFKIGGGAVKSSALAALLGFGSLTLVAFGKGVDFTPLGKLLITIGIGSLIFIICSALFGFSLGVGFSVLMITIAGGTILFNTSNIIYNYGEDDYVAAAIQLSSSTVLVFWYVIQRLRSRS